MVVHFLQVASSNLVVVAVRRISLCSSFPPSDVLCWCVEEEPELTPEAIEEDVEGVIFFGVTGDQILTKLHPLCAFSSFLPLFFAPFYLPFILASFEWGFTA